MATMNAEERIKKAAALLSLADMGLKLIAADAEAGQPETLDQKAEKFEEILKSDAFPMQHARDYQERLRALRRDAYQKSVEMLLEQVEQLAKIDDVKGRNEVLGKARTNFAAALRFGADEDFKRAAERRIEVVMLTTAEGIDKRAKEVAARRAAEELRETTGKGLPGRERRRCVRYEQPCLTVQLGGQNYQTGNWSVRGLLIENYQGTLQPGDRVKMDLSCEGIPGGGRVVGRVVTHNEKNHTLSFDLDGISTVMLGLMHSMKVAGIPPIPER